MNPGRLCSQRHLNGSPAFGNDVVYGEEERKQYMVSMSGSAGINQEGSHRLKEYGYQESSLSPGNRLVRTHGRVRDAATAWA